MAGLVRADAADDTLVPQRFYYTGYGRAREAATGCKFLVGIGGE